LVPADVNGNPTGEPNPDFRTVDFDVRFIEDLNNDLDGEDGISGTMVSANVYEAPLFLVEFAAGAAGSVTTLQLGDSTDSTQTSFFAPPDEAGRFEIDTVASYGSSQIVVEGVPEPGSLLALSALMMGGMLRRRRG